jgi:hypothetical protein
MRRSYDWAAAACLAATLVSCTLLDARGADDYPYSALILRDEAEVFAGPGHKYYATNRLAKGATVEVYAEDSATGFLAIRPPDQSFSWVSAEHVKLDSADPKIAEVTAPTHSWIGTDVEHIRDHKFQVRLPVGEVLEVIGERKVQTGDGQKQTWYKIVPPAGEFRWIDPKNLASNGSDRADDIAVADDTDAEIELAAAEMPSREKSGGRRTDTSKARRTTEVDNTADSRRPRAPSIPLRDMREGGSLVDEAVKQAQYSASGLTPTARPKTTGDGFVPRKPRRLESGASIPSPVTSPTDSSLSRTAAGTTSPLSSNFGSRSDERVARAEPRTSSISRSFVNVGSNGLVSSADVKNELDAIEVDLSLMLAQPRESWDLSSFRSRVQQLVDKGETAADRGEARLMQQKLEQIAQTFNVGDAPSLNGTTGYAAVAREAADPRYDGEGWLKPVLSRTRQVAPYALVDSDGKPICFVTPSPGFRIEGYVNKRVGVYGRRGVVESLNAKHVMAERVIDLDRVVR